MHGNLLRVFNHLYDSRPDDLARIMAGAHDYWQFVPLSYGLNKQIFFVVENISVPLEAQVFPTLRYPNAWLSGKAESWTLWDGEKEWRIDGELTPEQRKLWFINVATPSYLVGHIEEQWIPEMDPR